VTPFSHSSDSLPHAPLALEHALSCLLPQKAAAVSPRRSFVPRTSGAPAVPVWRRQLQLIVGHNLFALLVYLVILYSTIIMALYDHHVERDVGSVIRPITMVSDWAVLIFFTFEMLLKLAAFGRGGCRSCFASDRAAVGEHLGRTGSGSSVGSATSQALEEMGAEELRAKIEEEEHGLVRVAEPEVSGGYFASSWNCFDCAVVLITWALVPLQFVDTSNQDLARIARILRIVRPLRALRAVSGARDVLNTFPQAVRAPPAALPPRCALACEGAAERAARWQVPAIGDVLALLAFIIIVWAILGLNLFGLDGQFHGRCVADSPAAEVAGTRGLLLQGFLDGAEPLCHMSGDSCPEGFRCSCRQLLLANGSKEERPFAFQDAVTGDQGCMQQETPRPWLDGGGTPDPVCPNYGYECWDDFLLSVYVCFTRVTMDSWTSSMWYAQEAFSFWVGLIFYYSLVGIAAFNVVNLNVAVISAAYTEVRTAREEEHSLKVARQLRIKRLKAARAALLGAAEDAAPATGRARQWYSLLREEFSARAIRRHLAAYYAAGVAPRKQPLGGVSWLVARMLQYPAMIDECGNVLAPDLAHDLQRRDLAVSFGPNVGAWTLTARARTVRLDLEMEAAVVKRDTEAGRQEMRDAQAEFADAARTAGLRDIPLRSWEGSAPASSTPISGGRWLPWARAPPAEAAPGAGGRSGTQNGSDLTDGTACTPGERVGSCDGNDEGHARLRLAILGFRPVAAASRAEEQPLPELRTDSASWFDLVIITLVVANTVAMTLEHFDGAVVEMRVSSRPEDNCCDSECLLRDEASCPRGIRVMNENWMTAYMVMDGVFDAAFLLELILRLIANASFKRYICENYPFQVLDFFIVSTSVLLFVVELFVPKIFNVAIFRIFRVGRVFRLISKFRRLRLLVAKAVRSFVNILHVLFVMVFWHVLCAILGLQLFDCEVRDAAACEMLPTGDCPEECSLKIGNPPQCVFSDDQQWDRCPWDEYWNFNSLPTALILLIFVTTGENWTDQLAAGMRSMPSVVPGLIFFVVFYVVSFYMLLNLFTGVILEEFELTDRDRESLQLGAFRVGLLKKMRAAKLVVQDVKQERNGDAGLSFGGAAAMHAAQQATSAGEAESSVANSADIAGRTAKILPARARQFLRTVVEHPRFDALVMLAICSSTLILALESPVAEFAVVRDAQAAAADIVFFCFFAIEAVLKIAHFGALSGKRAYFRQRANLFDFGVLALQGLDLLGLQGLKSMRAFRVLRPLRILSRLENLQLLIASMQGAVPDIISVVILWLCACIGFSICAIQIFAGMLWRCNDSDFVGPPLNPGLPEGSLVGWRENCIGSYFPFESDSGAYVADDTSTFIMKPRVWSNPADGASGVGWHFDNFMWAFQTLYEVSTFELWSDVVFSTTDITGHAQQPITYASTGNSLFFHAWIIISCFFLLQLVIGVLIEAINRKSGVSLLTDVQRNFKLTRDRIRNLEPEPPEWRPAHPWRLAAWHLSQHPHFQNGITMLVAVNVIIMMTESYDQPEYWNITMEWLNIAFLAAYLIEAVIKLFAFLHRYFQDPWNVFDLFVVLASLVETLAVSTGVGAQALRALRIFKVVRAFRLVRRVKRFFLLCRSFAAAMPRVRSTSLLLILFIFVFAMFGVQLFAGVRFGTGLHELNNFRTTLEAMLTLVRVMTGENWQTTMHDCQIEAPLCTTTAEAREITGDPDALGDCGSFIGGVLFFDIFFFAANNILFNLFVAVQRHPSRPPPPLPLCRTDVWSGRSCSTTSSAFTAKTSLSSRRRSSKITR
jgi:hypothetical protein